MSDDADIEAVLWDGWIDVHMVLRKLLLGLGDYYQLLMDDVIEIKSLSHTIDYVAYGITTQGTATTTQVRIVKRDALIERLRIAWQADAISVLARSL